MSCINVNIALNLILHTWVCIHTRIHTHRMESTCILVPVSPATLELTARVT